ncbi:MAG: DNA repair protein RecO [Alphaproteobacteria bacterium]
MEWTDDAFVLAARPHGESAAVVQLLTRCRGRHAGLVRGGARRRALIEPGNRVVARWRARLADHLGAYVLEPVRSNAAEFLDDPERLGALAAVCAVAEGALPEREPHPAVFDAMDALLASMAADNVDHGVWPAIYVRWELGLLSELGFGLDLSQCASTGASDQLAYVSPRTGRAVSLTAGEPYRDKLLTLPPFLVGGPAPDRSDIAAGLKLTGHFLARYVFHPMDKPLPPARDRMIVWLIGREAQQTQDVDPG